MQEVAYPDEPGTKGGVKGIPTRRSLLSRLKNWDDNESWKLFFDTYWRLIYNTATRAGLNDAEAQDVVQETIISVFKAIPAFQYDSTKGTFKGWLLRLTKRRIIDHKRKQQREPADMRHQTLNGRKNEESDFFDNVPDPAGVELEAIWDAEWDRNLWEAALNRVKAKVDLKQYQIFDLYVAKDWTVSDVCRVMKVSPGQVYLIKHRIQKLLKEEFRGICTKPI